MVLAKWRAPCFRKDESYPSAVRELTMNDPLFGMPAAGISAYGLAPSVVCALQFKFFVDFESGLGQIMRDNSRSLSHPNRDIQ